MILTILLIAGLLLCTALVLWLSVRAPVIEECDCEECQKDRSQQSPSVVPPPKSTTESVASHLPAPHRPEAASRRDRRTNPQQRTEMVRIDDRVAGTILTTGRRSRPTF